MKVALNDPDSGYIHPVTGVRHSGREPFELPDEIAAEHILHGQVKAVPVAPAPESAKAASREPFTKPATGKTPDTVQPENSNGSS